MEKNLNLVLTQRESLKVWVHLLSQEDPNPELSEENILSFLDYFVVDLVKKNLATVNLVSPFLDEYAKAVALQNDLEVFEPLFRSEFLYSYRAAPKGNRLLDPIVDFVLLINRLSLDECQFQVTRMQRTSAFDFAVARLSILLGVDKNRILETLA